MFWREEDDDAPFVVPDDIVDLQFAISCRALPVDHAAPLAAAIRQQLPWFADEPAAGLHLIYGADSGNGWERPEQGDELLYLSRRTPLVLRLPRHRLDDAMALTGSELQIAGQTLQIGRAKPRLLSDHPAQYARFVVSDEGDDEDRFIARVVTELQQLQLQFKKVLCGRRVSFQFPDATINARSVMVADLPKPDAVKLQQHGIGSHRQSGFGLFQPHKTVTRVAG